VGLHHIYIRLVYCSFDFVGCIRHGSWRKTEHLYSIKCLLVSYLLRCTHRTVAPVGAVVCLIHVNMGQT